MAGTVSSKNELCNMANGSLGLRNSINDIDNPRNDKEITYKQWYDPTRQYMLQYLMPNFALYRLKVSQVTVPAGYVDYYGYAYEYPVRCLKLLGIGAINCLDDPPTVEGGIIFTNTLWPNGAPLRIVDDVTDVTRFSPDFVFLFIAVLAKVTALQNTQDPNKKASMIKDALEAVMNSSAQNAQENKPIKRSISRFRQSRYYRPYGGTGSPTDKR